MTFGELVDHAQKKGCSLLAEKIEQRKGEGFKTYAEPSMRNNSGEVVCAPDGLKLPLRSDLAFVGSSGEAQTEYADSSALNFREPVFARWEDKLKIEIHSISWDYMHFQLFPPPETETNWDGLKTWFMRWFNAEDEKSPNADGLSGIVHFISDPEVEPDRIEIYVDFGSAPTDALAEFFDELVKLDIKVCMIGKPCDPAQFIVKE